MLPQKLALNTTMKEIIAGKKLNFEEVVSLLDSLETKELFDLAGRICQETQGDQIQLCTIINAKSGKCSEDCKYCAQSGRYATGVKEYPLIDKEIILKTAWENEQAGVKRFSLVTSGKRLTKAEFNQVLDLIRLLKAETSLEICASLGSLAYEAALQLKEAGLSTYHHNLETSRAFFSQICTTHTYAERIETIHNLQRASLAVCAGGIIGLGENEAERIKMALELRDLNIKSIPINFLQPIAGTPLGSLPTIDPQEAIKTVAIFRIINPTAVIRFAGGRNILGHWQAVGLKAGVNGMMVGNYLTTIGNEIADDLKLIADLSLKVG